MSASPFSGLGLSGIEFGFEEGGYAGSDTRKKRKAREKKRREREKKRRAWLKKQQAKSRSKKKPAGRGAPPKGRPVRKKAPRKKVTLKGLFKPKKPRTTRAPDGSTIKRAKDGTIILSPKDATKILKRHGMSRKHTGPVKLKQGRAGGNVVYFLKGRSVSRTRFFKAHRKPAEKKTAKPTPRSQMGQQASALATSGLEAEAYAEEEDYSPEPEFEASPYSEPAGEPIDSSLYWTGGGSGGGGGGGAMESYAAELPAEESDDEEYEDDDEGGGGGKLLIGGVVVATLGGVGFWWYKRKQAAPAA
jgi:hypothetical protein